MSPLLRSFLVLLVISTLHAAEVDELVQAIIEDIPTDELTEPGSVVLPTKLAELLAEDLGLEQADEWELMARVAEAWLGAEDSQQALTHAQQLLNESGGDPLWRDRAGSVFIEAWAIEIDQAVARAAIAADDEQPLELLEPEPIAKRLAEAGDFGNELVARARVLDGKRMMDAQSWDLAQAHFDGALATLKEASARARVPVYTLRVLAMEAAEVDSEAIMAWLQQFHGDPAIDLVLASLLTDSQKLVGTPAPELALPQLLSEDSWKLTDHAGQVLVLYVFATWSMPCAAVTPVVVQQAQASPDVAFVGLSLDNRDTVGRLGEYKARFGIDFPIVGEQLGWDGEADDQLHVEAIPSLIVIGPDGRIEAVDLIRDEPDQTAAALREAVNQVQAEVNPAPAKDDFP